MENNSDFITIKTLPLVYRNSRARFAKHRSPESVKIKLKKKSLPVIQLQSDIYCRAVSGNESKVLINGQGEPADLKQKCQKIANICYKLFCYEQD